MTECVTIGNATLYCGDSKDVLPLITDKVDSVVTDPPYGLSFMNKGWDYEVPQPGMWKLVNAVMKDGAHLLSFFGSRTYHRGCCAIEDGGFDIRDQIMWLYGSGFPKSLDVSKAIDKAAGAERDVIGKRIFADGSTARQTAGASGIPESGSAGQSYITAPSTVEALQWNGWKTALKPAHEPIVVARKPLRGTVADNVLANGTGALNIDACRVGADGGTRKSADDDKCSTDSVGGYLNARAGIKIDGLGRYPANLIHDGSDEVLAGFPITKDGSAARYFYCAKASRKDRDEGLDRNSHPTVKPTDLMRYLCRLVTPPSGIVLDPFMGSGSTGKAAVLEGFKFIGIERDPKYFEIAVARIKAAQGL